MKIINSVFKNFKNVNGEVGGTIKIQFFNILDKNPG